MNAMFGRITIALLIAAALTAGVTIWQQHGQLQTAATRLDEFRQANTELSTANKLQADRLQVMYLNARAQAAATQLLAERLDNLARQNTAKAVQLEAAFHATQAATEWANTAIPADVARLLDTTQAATATATADPADLSTGNDLPSAGTGPDEKPAAGEKPAATPGGA